MEKRTKVMISFAFMVFLIMGLYFFSDWFSKTTGYSVEGEGGEIALANCLAEKGVKLYGSKRCPNCNIQKDLLGRGFDVLDYEECNGHPGRCQELKGVPAWEFEGQIYYGLKSLEELRILFGCSDV